MSHRALQSSLAFFPNKVVGFTLHQCECVFLNFVCSAIVLRENDAVCSTYLPHMPGVGKHFMGDLCIVTLNAIKKASDILQREIENLNETQRD
jgi:hypothetical protein